MEKMIGYISGLLLRHEITIEAAAKTLRKQKSFNRKMVLFAIIATAGFIVQYDEICNLKTEIKELKNTEGD